MLEGVNMLDLVKLFEGYVKNYHTLNLTIYHGRHSFTTSEIGYFNRLGSMLGFTPFTEDTVNGSQNPLDLTWWYGDDEEGWDDFILHLERENLFAKDYETLEKLFCEREHVPQHVIGIMNVKSEKRVRELVECATKLCKVKDALLIFKTNSTESDKDYFDSVFAYILKKGRVRDFRTAIVLDIEGLLYMKLEKEVKEWKEEYLK